MKKFISAILCIILIFSSVVNVFASETHITSPHSVILLRAGGGGGSGGSSGGSSGGANSGNSANIPPVNSGALPNRSESTTEHSAPLDSVFLGLIFALIFFASSILFYLRMSRYSRKSKKLIKRLTKQDSTWKINDISEAVRECFFAVQNAWSESDMTPAKQHMSEDLFKSFQIKLNWMTYRNQKNIMKDIKLIHALPVAVHDEDDNSRDCIWFYIKGRMIDYTIDTKTQEIINGKILPASFEEFWQFTRNNNTWVLNKILQKNESTQIPFNK